jgi:hypothetical protein
MHLIEAQIGADLFKLIYKTLDSPEGCITGLIGVSTTELIIEISLVFQYSKPQGVQGSHEERQGRREAPGVECFSGLPRQFYTIHFHQLLEYNLR